MAKSMVAVLIVALAGMCASAQEAGLLSGESQPNRSDAFVGSPLTCSQTQVLHVPRPAAERAKLKARLITLLRESLFDDAKGMVNIAREKEIKKLASKLKRSD